MFGHCVLDTQTSNYFEQFQPNLARQTKSMSEFKLPTPSLRAKNKRATNENEKNVEKDADNNSTHLIVRISRKMSGNGKHHVCKLIERHGNRETLIAINESSNRKRKCLQSSNIKSIRLTKHKDKLPTGIE